jgi:hypothetical protein
VVLDHLLTLSATKNFRSSGDIENVWALGLTESFVVAEVEFEWIIVTSPEAATVFLRAWK